MNSIFKTFVLSVLVATQVHFAYAQTASILPPAKTTFNDANGKPLVSGTVDFYIPSTTTRKTTWQDAAETIPNANPVVLDAAGRALILGSGSYRQVVKDRLSNVIWDQVTSSAGSGGGGGSTATGDGDLVGTIKPWAGMTAPNQYVFTYGQELSRTTYSVLFTAITSTQAVFCNSGSPILNGLSDTTNFWIGMPVEVSCIAAGNSTIISKTSTTITLAVNANVTVGTNAILFPWGRGNGSTTFNMPDFRGFAIAGNNNMGGIANSVLTTTYFGATNPNSSGAAGGNESTTMALVNLISHTHINTLTDLGHFHTAFHVASSNAGGAADVTIGAGARIIDDKTSTVTSGITLTNVAAGSVSPTPMRTVQPTKTSNYIIKVLPDDNSATASGVTALGGMTGSIACGNGLLCTGNIVSVVTSSSFNSYIYPQSYGAMCDGVTNDAVALQTWLTAINTLGKTGYVLGTCVTGTTLVGLSNTSITGGGREQSVLKGITNANPILSFSNKSNISITNLALEGSDSISGSWAGSPIGAISIIQNGATATNNYIFKDLKFSKFNTTYWVSVNAAGSTNTLSNVTFENNYISSVLADIPTDATPSNNGNYGLVVYSGSVGGGQVQNVNVKNNRIEGTALCFGVTFYGNIYKYQIQENSLLNVGNTNISHCVNGAGTTNNSYAILVYDVYGDGNPALDGLIENNYILLPYSAGIYFAGDGLHTALSFNNSNTLISGNLIYGQSSNDDTLLPRAAISLNINTNIHVVGNKLYSNYQGVALNGQQVGTINISNNDCNTLAGSGAPHPVSCLNIQAGAGTTGNTLAYVIKDNNFDVGSGATSKVVRSLASNTNYFGSIDFSNNRIVASDFGAFFNGIYINKNLVIANNHFSGVAATSMLDAGAINIGVADIRDNIFDLNLSTTGTGLITTNSVAYLSGNKFWNRNAGAAFAFSGVGTTGTLNNMQFNNVATANQVVATSIGLAIPTWSAASQDFVQNLNATGTTELTSSWLNTANGVNWKAEIEFTAVAANVGAWIATPSSANLRAALTDETGTGAAVFAGGALGAATATSINGSTISPGHYSGEPSTGNAAAGEIGEYIESVIVTGSATALTTGTGKTVTSISLTAGDWDVSLTAYYNPAATTNITFLTCSTSLTTNTLDTTAGRFYQLGYIPGIVTGGPNLSCNVVPRRFSLSGTTSIFMVVQTNFTVSTLAAWGTISARRAR